MYIDKTPTGAAVVLLALRETLSHVHGWQSRTHNILADLDNARVFRFGRTYNKLSTTLSTFMVEREAKISSRCRLLSTNLCLAGAGEVVGFSNKLMQAQLPLYA